MECPYCKAENPEGGRYCGSCGKLLNTAPADPTRSSSISRSLVPGTRLQGGRYVIKQALGQGGMGAALLATDIRLDGKLVVIKELISDHVDDTKLQEDVRNFKREVALLAHIDHPLIPDVTDHFQEGTRYFMVQEYVEGENVEDRLNRLGQPMKEREVLVCASEILDVLDYLSQQMPPIVHRDIKPSNIIIGAKDRRAHLVDFGIARAQVARNALRKQTSALGTPGYAPPEQYQGNADPRSDLYALAATIHHLLTNRDPRNHPPFTYPPVRAQNPQLSPELERVLTRALTNDINQRYQSAVAMKQEIDDILLKRYGMPAGSINSYVLGTSGSMSTLASSPTSSSVANMPTVANMNQVAGLAAATPPHLPLSSPNQGLTPQSPYLPGGYMPPPSPPPPQKRRGLLVFALLALLLLLLVGTLGSFYVIRPLLASNNATSTPGASATSSTTKNGIGVTKVGNEIIGISDGSFVFDTGRGNSGLKTRASEHFRNGDISSAIALWNQAAGEVTNDPEPLIYLENQRVTTSPHVTIVVGTMLTGNRALVEVGRDNLQGAYIAQKEFNDGAKLAGGTQVKLLIANSGSQTAYAKQVAQQVIELARLDSTFVGVMGWPYSSRAVEVAQILGKAHIPMVSQTASSDQLTRISPYFFRVAPPNKVQAIIGARYAAQKLKAKTAALFLDIADPYSQSLGQGFAQQFEAGGNKIVATEHYTIGKTASIPTLLQDALSKKPDIIYFSGYAEDVSTVLVNLPAESVPIMGGDALYQLGSYPKAARSGFTRLRFTTFAYPDEWDVLGLKARKPAFFAEYAAAYDPNKQHSAGIYGFTRPANDVILSYDALAVLLVGCNNVLNAGKKSVTPETLREGLSKITGANAFQGVSGRIAFRSDGDPEEKAVVILYVDPVGYIKMEQTVEGRFLK
jgi:serine/threonine protein kinase/ABC-type branched-subunit amino acid transport system substrate-binding protein